MKLQARCFRWISSIVILSTIAATGCASGLPGFRSPSADAVSEVHEVPQPQQFADAEPSSDSDYRSSFASSRTPSRSRGLFGGC